uniref:Matrin-type domain-containing protein n=3 Tax=Cynoglossus semilaevis TaxID=244447 RepID=A0A3P8VX67_CYNSE
MWDWSPQLRRGEDERERDDPRRNGGSIEDDRHNGRAADRRKAYQKQLDHMSSRSADERGGSSGGSEAMRGNREWHSRGSPQGMSFNSYRSMDDDFYILEQMYKSDKQPRLPYQRHDSKLRRRDGGEYHSRSRHSEVEMSEESLRRTPEEKRQSSPSRGRSKKSNRRHAAEKFDKENNAKNTVGQTKERTVSPKKSDTPKEATECHKDRDTEKEPESGVDTDEECWYPKNMEELVTVDEVGEEDDSIIEPDLPEIDEDTAGPKPVLEKEAVEEHVPMPPLSPEQDVDKKTNQEKSCVESMDRKHTYITDDKENVVPATVPEEQKSANQSQAPDQSLNHSSNSPCQDIKTALEETSLEDKVPNSDLLEPHVTMSDTSKSQDTLHVTETITNGLQHKDGKKEMMATSPAREQDKAVSEHSIPLGVEFIVPRTGFFCKLCGLFYTSEENAKTTHCRSAVHYKNLQKYLSQLAEQSLSDAFYEPMTAQ